jgi:hypothetical protein
MADFDLLVLFVLVPPPPPASVPIAISIPIPVSALSVGGFCQPEEAEQGGASAAGGEAKRRSARRGFDRDRFCQLIEPSVVHA